MPSKPTRRGNMLDVIHQESDTVLNTGVVTSAADRSQNVFGEDVPVAERIDVVPGSLAQSSDEIDTVISRDNLSQGVVAKNVNTKTHTGGDPAAIDAFGSKLTGGTDAAADDVLSPDADEINSWQGIPTRFGAFAAAKAIDELDESDELSGVGDVYHGGRTLRRIGRRVSGLGSDKPEADTSKTSIGRKGKGAAKSAMKDAPSTKAKAASAKKAGAVGTQKAATAAQAAGGAAQTQAVAGQAATAAAASESTAAIGATAGSGFAAIGGVIAGIVAFLLGVLLVSQLISALFGFWENEEAKRAVAGLPPYITYSMVEAALQCQEDYGHPAGCTLAQIIVESGVGDHLSGLAAQDNNLFGIKWASSFASCPEVSGKSSWATYEEDGGELVEIMDDFTSFVSVEDCIKFRSRVFLQYDRYAGNALIQEAIAAHSSDKMAEGLKDAGYATSSSYVDSLKSTMDTYNLRRFDTMTVEDFKASQSGGNIIVEAAYGQLGVPYVWGGATPGVGLDCSGLTQYCYACAGISIAHYTETQLAQGTAIPLSEARAGDILYRYGHVAIYIGGDQYIHAPQEGDVVRVASGISYFTCAIRY